MLKSSIKLKNIVNYVDKHNFLIKKQLKSKILHTLYFIGFFAYIIMQIFLHFFYKNQLFLYKICFFLLKVAFFKQIFLFICFFLLHFLFKKIMNIIKI